MRSVYNREGRREWDEEGVAKEGEREVVCVHVEGGVGGEGGGEGEGGRERGRKEGRKGGFCRERRKEKEVGRVWEEKMEKREGGKEKVDRAREEGRGA